MTTDLRTGTTILESNECWALLRAADVGRLAVSIAERPDIFPVNFAVDHGTIVFRTAVHLVIGYACVALLHFARRFLEPSEGAG